MIIQIKSHTCCYERMKIVILDNSKCRIRRWLFAQSLENMAIENHILHQFTKAEVILAFVGTIQYGF